MREILGYLGVEKSSYYRWLKDINPDVYRDRRPIKQPYEVLPEEEAAVISYALRYPNLSHRILAWKMVDEDVA